MGAYDIQSMVPFGCLTRCCFCNGPTQQKIHLICGKQAGSCSLDNKKHIYPFIYLIRSDLYLTSLGPLKVSLPVIMCSRASLRFSNPTVSHCFVLSRYVVAMTGKVMRIMFCSPHPEGWAIRLPMDFPLIAFSTSEDIFSAPVDTKKNLKSNAFHLNLGDDYI